MDNKKQATWVTKSFLMALVLIVYLASTVPVGLFIYSIKVSNHIDVFSNTGFHSYMYCLKEQAKKMGDDKE